MKIINQLYDLYGLGIEMDNQQLMKIINENSDKIILALFKDNNSCSVYDIQNACINGKCIQINVVRDD